MKIIVPVDFSETTPKVMEVAVGFARKLVADLCLIHVTSAVVDKLRYSIGDEDYSGLGVPGGGYGSFIRYDAVRDQIAAELKAEHAQLLNLKKTIPADLKVRAILIQGEVVESILREADDVQADMIIMGSHGHSALH
ncbi:hypothetical protein BVX99_00240, partial [bacterium F16]